MLTAQEQVESWLTETIHRNIYLGREIVPRLRLVSESLKGSDEAAQEFIREWLSKIEEGDFVYRAVETQNRLIDLWALVTDFQSVVEEESLSPSVG